MSTSTASGRIQRPSDEPASNKLPILGVLRTGEKVKKGNVEYPQSLDYFKATGKFAARFHQAYGEQPSHIAIIFVSDDIKEVCNERYELRDSKGDLLGSGDGLNFKIWSKAANEGKGAYLDKVADTQEKLDMIFKMGEWKVILTIKFVIPKINDVYGVWKYETKAVLSSIPNIRDTFDNIKRAAGTVVNIPFDLIVEKVTGQKPGQKHAYPVVTLVANVGKERLDDVRKFIQGGNDISMIPELLTSNLKQVAAPAPEAAQIAAPVTDTSAQAASPPAAEGNTGTPTLFPGEKGDKDKGDKPGKK